MSEVVTITVEDVHKHLEGVEVYLDDAGIEASIEQALSLLAGICPRVRAVLSGAVKKVDPYYLLNIKYAVIEAVVRRARDDRTGLRMEEESAYKYERDSLSSSPDIWFTDKYLEALGCGKKRPSYIGTINTTPRPPMVAPSSRGWFC